MAINIYEKLSEKNAPQSSCSKSSNLSSCLMKLDYNADGSTTSSKNDNSQNKKSPYLKGDKVQMHSRVTERKLVRKKTDFVSSFPLAVNIYKANSDEFKVLKRGNKKIKKSVLTLPNDPAPVPQMCTVSDMNESEYFNETKDERKPKPRKKRTVQNKKQRKSKNVDVYDRDARYCSQLDIDLDSSSTDFINQFTGDGKKQTRRKVQPNKTAVRAHDVWTILKNLNQFQFVPSAPMSQESIVSAKRTNINKIRSSCRDARLIETCRTEEFAYISNYVDNSHSQSSLDRITVIEKQDDYQEICKELEKSVENCKPKFLKANQKKTKSKSTRKPYLKYNNKIQVSQEKSNNLFLTEKDHKNETTPLKIKSGIQKPRIPSPQNNKDDIQFCGDFGSSQTNVMDKTNTNKARDENKLHKNKSKLQINGITKVVLSKGNNITNKKNEILRRSPDLPSLPVAAVMPRLTQQEVQTPIANENQPQRLKRGKLTNHNNLKVVNNGEIKPNKPKQYQTNSVLIRNKQNNEINNVLIEIEPELKQKRQLKDKMLQFLYKKHQGDTDNTQEVLRTKVNKTVKNLVEVGTNTQINTALLSEANDIKANVSEIENVSPTSRRSKGKWASDFIESVIKKIRSGVYYNNEKHPYKGNYNKREDSSQTDINIINYPENTFNKTNYPKYTKPQFLTTDEKLLKTLLPHNPSKLNVDIFNSNQLAKELRNTDVFLHNKSKFQFQTPKRRYKKVDFEDFVYNTKINFGVPEEYNNELKENETGMKGVSPVKQSWVEGKWATDFIDNVFKKIKSGVYYSQDEHCLCRRYISCTKDDFSQTDNCSSKFNYDRNTDLNIITDKNHTHDSLSLIPGFDNTSNDLEIETFSQKQIVVKNCVTNVVVQFDVELPSDPCQGLQLKQSFSCIPVAVTESHTKIFKSKTTIINAFLPAELCSILPMMMRRIIASNTKFTLPKLAVGKVESNLCTISELTRLESPELPKQITYDIGEPGTPDIFLNIKSIKLFDCMAKPMDLIKINHNEPKFIQMNNSIFTLPNHKESCMALQLYQPLKKTIQAFKPFNLEYYIENIINTNSLDLILKMLLSINYFEIRCYNNNIAISVGFGNGPSNIHVKLTCSNTSKEFLNNNFTNSIECAKIITSSHNDHQNVMKDANIYTVKSTITEKRRSGSEFRMSNSKTKKRSFVKLYKKCKSMSNLTNNRQTISIDKITNTDEFVQALGSSKMLSAVIDGNTEHKILLSLKEMKTWMSDITPRQALLVLLLANKKDTPNVVSYRPVVLQGIAVNRITRASELDMEIEVIERENLNRLKQFEGISYLPASAQNQDTLLEELYWIAKTTASDYQRPFDESSKRLLKSLLEKRKKLNPSYLRVMARYVGLGLLKSSK